MKMKSLQMKKVALSVLFTLLLSVIGVTNAVADDQIAVLQHESITTAYYGANAFVEAHNAAETGDMITLSAGNFNTCEISKLITVHGAGVHQDSTVNDRTKTVFLGSFTFNVPGNEIEHLIMEGIYFSANIIYWRLNHSEFFRCIFNDLTPYNSGSWNSTYGLGSGDMSNCKFINCRIGTITINASWSGSCNVCLYNSIVYNTSGVGKTVDTEKNIIAYNSYIAYGGENIQCSNFYNCVIAGRPGCVPQETCTLYNCVMAKNGYEGSLLENAFHRDCIEVDTVSQIFENYTGEFYDEQFILNDEISSSIQGTDGTEVGIYGGMYPFYDIPKYMIMRRCTVGSRTTDDGHLSVDIEVVTEQ